MTDAVAIVQDNSALKALKGDEGFFTSLRIESGADRLKVLRAINDSKPLADVLGEKIKVVDFIAQEVDLTNDETGEISKAVRTTLIDEDGNAFHATSIGVFTQLKMIIKVLGEPSDWEGPLEVTPAEQKSGKFKFLTLKY